MRLFRMEPGGIDALTLLDASGACCQYLFWSLGERSDQRIASTFNVVGMFKQPVSASANAEGKLATPSGLSMNSTS